MAGASSFFRAWPWPGTIPTAAVLDLSCPGLTRASIEKSASSKRMDCRVKPGNDGGRIIHHSKSGGTLAAQLQQVAQIAHAGHALEREHALDQRGAFRRTQHRRDQVATLGDDLRARHRVVASAA